MDDPGQDAARHVASVSSEAKSSHHTRHIRSNTGPATLPRNRGWAARQIRSVRPGRTRSSCAQYGRMIAW
ncbi:hypothetical protein [Thermocatellispora tengchongensis]|uniref:hypothetical protein n=1 Tax=Thermocatellispora tengchongensis TaxID=1073253 RepID=UPI00362D3B19